MMAIQGFGAAFGSVYFLMVAAVSVLAIWALVLLIIFLRLKIAELRAGAGPGNPGGVR